MGKLSDRCDVPITDADFRPVDRNEAGRVDSADVQSTTRAADLSEEEIDGPDRASSHAKADLVQATVIRPFKK